MESDSSPAWYSERPPRPRAQQPTCQFRGAPAALAERPSPLDSVEIRLGDATAKTVLWAPVDEWTLHGRWSGPFWVSPWRLGANEPTTIHLPFPALIGGVEVAAGSYSLYAIPEEGSWTIVLNDNTNRWGIPISPDVRRSDVGSFVVATVATHPPGGNPDLPLRGKRGRGCAQV